MEFMIDVEEPLYSIGVVAKKFNLSVHTLRLYESEGLILPYKTDTKRRLYSQSDINRIACVRDLIEKRGLNIAGIKSLLAMIPCWQIKSCSEEDRNNCEAFTSQSLPCWIVHDKGEECQLVECRECNVYTSLSKCNNFKEYLKANWK
jgi:MerR family transcriptional regulator/heat shock protein HspR